MNDISNHLVNSHISNDEITNQVSELFSGSDSISNSIDIDLTPSIIPFLLIAIQLIKEKTYMDIKREWNSAHVLPVLISRI